MSKKNITREIRTTRVWDTAKAVLGGSVQL